MASTYDLALPPDIAAKERALKRREAMSMMLMQQAMNPRQPQQTGRLAVRQSWLAPLAQAATGYMAGKGMDRDEKAYAALGEEYRKSRVNDVAAVRAAQQGTPAIQQPAAALGGGPDRPAKPGTQQDVINAMLAAQSPDIQAEGLKRLGTTPKYSLGSQFDESGREQKISINTADPNDVRLLGGPKAADSNKAFNPDGTPNIAFQDYELKRRAAGRSQVSVNTNMPPQEKEFEKALGKGQAEALMKSQQDAGDATEILNTTAQGKKLLDSGMVTGFGAEYIVKLGQALKQAGMDFGGDDTSNAQAYSAVMAQNVGKIIKQFGAGTGLSDADREYAEKMAGGKINLDEKALRKIIDINERAASRIIARHNKRAQGIKTNIPLTVDAPEAAIPSGIDPALWGTMTPEERALWQK